MDRAVKQGNGMAWANRVGEPHEQNCGCLNCNLTISMLRGETTCTANVNFG